MGGGVFFGLRVAPALAVLALLVGGNDGGRGGGIWEGGCVEVCKFRGGREDGGGGGGGGVRVVVVVADVIDVVGGSTVGTGGRLELLQAGGEGG